MEAGRLDKRVTFQTEAVAADAGGGESVSWGSDLTVWGQFLPERGRERIEAGRLSAALAGILRVRSSTQTSQIAEGNRVLIEGEVYNIRSVAPPDRSGIREMTVEKGVAT